MALLMYKNGRMAALAIRVSCIVRISIHVDHLDLKQQIKITDWQLKIAQALHNKMASLEV